MQKVCRHRLVAECGALMFRKITEKKQGRLFNYNRNVKKT